MALCRGHVQLGPATAAADEVDAHLTKPTAVLKLERVTRAGLLTLSSQYVHLNSYACGRLHDALERLTAAIRDVESELLVMTAEHDPLASHIFISRRHYQNINDTKSVKRREMNARLSFNTACELGFRGSLDEWERLMGAVARR